MNQVLIAIGLLVMAVGIGRWVEVDDRRTWTFGHPWEEISSIDFNGERAYPMSIEGAMAKALDDGDYEWLLEAKPEDALLLASTGRVTVARINGTIVELQRR